MQPVCQTQNLSAFEHVSQESQSHIWLSDTIALTSTQGPFLKDSSNTKCKMDIGR